MMKMTMRVIAMGTMPIHPSSLNSREGKCLPPLWQVIETSGPRLSVVIKTDFSTVLLMSSNFHNVPSFQWYSKQILRRRQVVVYLVTEYLWLIIPFISKISCLEKLIMVVIISPSLTQWWWWVSPLCFLKRSPTPAGGPHCGVHTQWESCAAVVWSSGSVLKRQCKIYFLDSMRKGSFRVWQHSGDLGELLYSLENTTSATDDLFYSLQCRLEIWRKNLKENISKHENQKNLAEL